MGTALLPSPSSLSALLPGRWTTACGWVNRPTCSPYHLPWWVTEWIRGGLTNKQGDQWGYTPPGSVIALGYVALEVHHALCLVDPVVGFCCVCGFFFIFLFGRVGTAHLLSLPAVPGDPVGEAGHSRAPQGMGVCPMLRVGPRLRPAGRRCCLSGVVRGVRVLGLVLARFSVHPFPHPVLVRASAWGTGAGVGGPGSFFACGGRRCRVLL